MTLVYARLVLLIYVCDIFFIKPGLLSHLCTAIENASTTLLSFFAEVSMYVAILFSSHHCFSWSYDTSLSFEDTSDWNREKGTLKFCPE